MNLQGGTANLQGSPATIQGGGGASILQPASGIPSGNPTILVGGGNAAAPAAAAPAPAVTSATTGTSSNDPNAVAYYNDVITQLQSQLDAAKAQQGTGLANIDNAYNRSLTEQNQAESNAESGYATQRVQNGQQREGNVNSINENARGAYDSLLAILGANGAGVSSAAKYAGPQAVSRQASGQRAGADTTYNANNTSIGTAENQTKDAYNSALTDLLNEKNTNVQNFESGLLNTEGSIQQQIRDAQINRSEQGGQSYAAAARGAGNTTKAVSDIQQRLSDLFKQYATPTFNVNPVKAVTPDVTKYSVDPASVRVANANPTIDSSFAPYLASLKPGANSILTGGGAGSATAGAAT